MPRSLAGALRAEAAPKIQVFSDERGWVDCKPPSGID
jgi:hypothetical protein